MLQGEIKGIEGKIGFVEPESVTICGKNQLPFQFFLDFFVFFNYKRYIL